MGSRKKPQLFRKHYSDYKWATHIYRDFLKAYCTSNSITLDFGAGKGINNRLIPDNVIVHGVDSHPSIFGNNRLTEKHQISDSKIPYPDNTFDVVMSTWVLEHLDRPDQALKEIKRVLRPGGRFIFLTCNKYHYVSMIARMTPQWFHEMIIPKIRGRKSEDVFPTYYRINSRSLILHLTKEYGFTKESLIFKEPPPLYLGFSTLTFQLGRYFQKLVSKYDRLAGLRHGIVGVFKA